MRITRSLRSASIGGRPETLFLLLRAELLDGLQEHLVLHGLEDGGLGPVGDQRRPGPRLRHVVGRRERRRAVDAAVLGDQVRVVRHHPVHHRSDLRREATLLGGGLRALVAEILPEALVARRERGTGPPRRRPRAYRAPPRACGPETWAGRAVTPGPAFP